ncbi:hypothetical protein SNE40_018429 [Patella caerulea]|uniref:SH2 domain-containing protein n=1 Tax=Patella caerulea TaxID=87958 RepID=A0AAN8JAP1_PATCE
MDKQSLSPEEQIKDQRGSTHQYDFLRYYWKHLNREEAIEKLKYSPNGSFLIRDSSTEAVYVLVLRDRGTTNNIKIFCKNGKYGFAEPFTFNSVADVINHYSEESLHKHSHLLDTKLLYPMCLNIDEMVEIHGITETDSLHYFIHLAQYYQHQRKCLDNEFDNIMKLSQKINLSVTLLDALKQTIEIFNEQLKTLQDNMEAIDATDTESISKINGCLRNRIEDVEKNVYKRFEIYNNDKKLYEKAAENLCCKKFVCKGLKQHVAHLRRYIQNLKLVSDNFLSVMVDDERDGDVLHRNPQFWLLKGETKEQADEILADKPRGTFLVRYSKGDVRYILSVMCDEEVKHFDIFYSPVHQSYGLTQNTCLFKSLTELIIKYRRISLAEHFQVTDVNLICPVIAV